MWHFAREGKKKKNQNVFKLYKEGLILKSLPSGTLNTEFVFKRKHNITPLKLHLRKIGFLQINEYMRPKLR